MHALPSAPQQNIQHKLHRLGGNESHEQDMHRRGKGLCTALASAEWDGMHASLRY